MKEVEMIKDYMKQELDKLMKDDFEPNEQPIHRFLIL